MTRGIKHRMKAKSKNKVSSCGLVNPFYDLTSFGFIIKIILKSRARRKGLGLLHLLWSRKFQWRCGSRVWTRWRMMKSSSVILLLTILFMLFTLDGPVWGRFYGFFLLFPSFVIFSCLALQKEKNMNKLELFFINKTPFRIAISVSNMTIQFFIRVNSFGVSNSIQLENLGHPVLDFISASCQWLSAFKYVFGLLQLWCCTRHFGLSSNRVSPHCVFHGRDSG